MATPTGKTQCVRCGKNKCTLKCTGCSKDFCLNHLTDYRQELSQQLDEIEGNRDVFQESLAEEMKKVQDNPLIQQISTWENDSIKKIKETAETAKQSLIQHITEHYKQTGIKLDTITNQLRKIREENDFNEIILCQFQDELTRLKTEPLNLPIISIRKDSWSCISDVHAKLPAQSDVYMKNIQQMAAIQNRLDPTHQQMDDSFRDRIQQISGKISTDTSRVVADTKDEQSTLLTDANDRIAAIEKEYKIRLQKYVEELDVGKAHNLTTLQKDLHLRQAIIFEQARKRIDDFYEEANRSKMSILQETRSSMHDRDENMTKIRLNSLKIKYMFTSAQSKSVSGRMKIFSSDNK